MDGFPNDPCLLTASQAAAALRAGQVTSVELVEALLARIARCNPRLNAIVTLDAQGARRQAAQADAALRRGQALGPLHGVPVTVKDSFETAGMRTVSGYPPFAGRVPAEDAPPVRRLRQAGAILLGKTNLPPLASGIQTDNPVFGRTNNPWDLGRTPGGSSGGAAAAISAGLSFLELGSDIGGSIRIPAHFCGVYGLKTTGGRVSGKGHLASRRPIRPPAGERGSQQLNALLQLGSMGPLARSIDDLRLAFPILAEPGGPGLEPQPDRPLSELRLAWSIDFGGAPLDRDSRQALEQFIRALAQAGCRVEQADPGFDYERAWHTAGACLGAINTLFQPALVQWARRLAAPVLGRSGAHTLERGLYAGVGLNPRRLAQILNERQALIEQLEGFLERWDAWICPVFPTPAFTHRPAGAAIEVDEGREAQLLANLLHCLPFNASGHPVVSLPAGQAAGGLPVGVQLAGRKWQEQALLNVAGQVAAAGVGSRRPPEFH